MVSLHGGHHNIVFVSMASQSGVVWFNVKLYGLNHIEYNLWWRGGQ